MPACVCRVQIPQFALAGERLAQYLSAFAGKVTDLQVCQAAISTLLQWLVLFMAFVFR